MMYWCKNKKDYIEDPDAECIKCPDVEKLWYVKVYPKGETKLMFKCECLEEELSECEEAEMEDDYRSMMREQNSYYERSRGV